MALLTWTGVENRRTAALHGCTFTLTKMKRGYRLRGKGTIPPDGGFNIDASGSEEKTLAYAELLVAACVKVANEDPKPTTTETI